MQHRTSKGKGPPWARAREPRTALTKHLVGFHLPVSDLCALEPPPKGCRGGSWCCRCFWCCCCRCLRRIVLPTGVGARAGVRGVMTPSLVWEGWGEELPPVGGGAGGFRTDRRLLTMSALMSAGVGKRVLPFVAPTACYLQFHRLFSRFVVRRLAWSSKIAMYICMYMLPLCVFQSLLGECRSIQD
jgi:hypothetical protein